MHAHRQVTHGVGSQTCKSNGVGGKQRTRRLRNVQRSQNEMHEAIAWQQAAVGVAVREGISQIANASVDVRSDSDVQTPSRNVAWRTGGHKSPNYGTIITQSLIPFKLARRPFICIWHGHFGHLQLSNHRFSFYRFNTFSLGLNP